MINQNVSQAAIHVQQVSQTVQTCFSGKGLDAKELAEIITKECARFNLGLNSRDYLVNYLTSKMCHNN
jgi:20S proteasome alpha/beta subunit